METGESERADLDSYERSEVKRHRSAKAATVHEAIRRDGDSELSRKPSALAWSGLAAGLSMGLSLVMEGLLRAYLPQAEWAALVSKLGYSAGFVVVVLGKQQLFTETTVTAVIPLLQHCNGATFRKVAVLWAIVLAANLAGAHGFAWAAAATPAFQAEAKAAFLEIGREALRVSFGEAVLRGIFAGWIIATMVWVLAALEEGRILVVVLLSYAVALASLTHIVAGAVETLYVFFAGQISWSDVALGYLLPTLIGNALGGVALVSALNHAQVVSGGGKR